MSTPIGDTAEYFAHINKQQSQGSTPPTLITRFYRQQHASSDPQLPHSYDVLSPESPESRRPLPTVLGGRHTPIQTETIVNSHSQQPFDPRAQWNRLRDRLSLNVQEGHRNNDSLQIPHRYSHQRRTTRWFEVHHSSSDDDSSSVSEAYELTPQGKDALPSHGIDGIEDDVLPSTADLPTEEQSNDDQQNYFADPFEPSASDEQTEQPPAVQVPQEEDISDAPLGNNRARHRWGKTLDKIRLISNLQNLPQQPRDIGTGAGNSLAPYYQPAFDPLFIAQSLDDRKRKLPRILLPCLLVDVTDSKVVATEYGFYHIVFRIELQYGDVKWVLQKTMGDFYHLHISLKLKLGNIPMQSSILDKWGNIIRTAKTAFGVDMDDELEASKDKDMALNRRKDLTKYLRTLLQRAHLLVPYEICEFLEISAISIAQDMGWKGKEGYLDHRVHYLSTRFCGAFRQQGWSKEWVILRDSYIAFCSNIASTSPSDVFLLDKHFTVSDKTPGIFGQYHHHITLQNRFHRITLKGDKSEIQQWMNDIKKVQKDSLWVKTHQFNSFAPIRHQAKVKWYVDGEDHFNSVAEAILSARSEIYIADWWLSPELYLRRPPEKNEEFRLDRLLKRKAEEGVMIYIIVYKEMQVALKINSAHTKSWLQKQHPNIIVQRHPDHRSIDNTVLLWSHHEKIVVVDNRLAFIGGLDLCFGRWDTHHHRLTDYPAEGHDYTTVPGQDYSNPRVKDFVNVTQHETTLVDREVTPRMPWHDAGIGVVGPIARDIARHFIQRWNFLKTSKGMHRSSVPLLMPKGEYVPARDESKFKGTCRVQLLRSSAQWSSGIEREHSIYNAYMEVISKAKHFVYIENQFFISSTTYDKVLRNKIGQAIVERIRKAHDEGKKFKVFILIPLIPAFEGDLASPDAYSAQAVMHFEYVSISRGGNSIIEKLEEAGINWRDYIGWYSLRSWEKLKPRKSPLNMNKKMDSGAILDEKEQQNTRDDAPPLPRTVDDPLLQSGTSKESGSTLLDEVEDPAHFVSELIYIHDKLLIADDRIVLIGSANINDRSMLGNRDSEIGMLIQDTETVPSYMDGKEYKAAKFAQTLRMRLWKEHLGLLDFNDWSKLMDKSSDNTSEKLQTRRMTCGLHSGDSGSSADEETIRDIESHRPDQVLDTARRSGMDKATDSLEAAAALDPLNDHCYYNIWKKTANSNTLIYRELFRCVPDDTVHTFEQHHSFTPDPSKIPHGHIADPSLSGQEVRQKLEQVRGHLVEFPLDYLKNENMMGTSFQQTVVPTVVFT